MLNNLKLKVAWLLLSAAVVLPGCSWLTPKYPNPPDATYQLRAAHKYKIGPGDSVEIFVWRYPEVSTTVPVRPDGFITAPLLEDIPAAGKTPTELARDLEEQLAVYLRDPLVTVIVQGFVGVFFRTRSGSWAKPPRPVHCNTWTV